MKSNNRKRLLGLQRRGRSASRRLSPRIEALEGKVVLAGFLQTNLVSDIPGLAQLTDPNLVNPWGVSLSTKSPFWVSNQGTNTSTLYAVTHAGISQVPLVVSIPTTGGGPQGPTGQVNNNTTSFELNGNPAAFIFANLNGTISAWNGGGSATLEWTTPGAVYTGLAIATDQTGSYLYAADDAGGKIDVFDGTFMPHDFGPGSFVDPRLPAGLVPFNVANLGGNIFVTYAPAGHLAQIAAHPGQGAVAEFTTDGTFIQQLISGNRLASPWGVAMAPAGFGQFGDDLLVGNFAFGFSSINAFNPTNAAYQGTITDTNGNAIVNPGLWSLTFGNGVKGGDPNTLYFSAGINGEHDGLFGSLAPIPALSRLAPIVPNLPNGAFQTLSTVPSNGDVNPYGVAFVPFNFPSGGTIRPGDILVSNFNNSSNQQGTGTTIVSIAPNGSNSVFFQGPAAPGAVGLTTALGVLSSGYVIVGNLPATYDSNGNLVSIGQGSLEILDKSGNVVETMSSPDVLDGPWDLTVNDQGAAAQVFVSNVLSGGVTRIDLGLPVGAPPIVRDLTQIASGYMTRTDPAALVVGPTGLAYNRLTGTLFVASTGDNAIYAIGNAAFRRNDAGKGRLIYSDDAHLRGPLGLVLAPNGDLIAANGDAVNPDPNQASELVEFTQSGRFVGQFSIDPQQGGAFGVATSNFGGILRVAAVEDITNSVDVWTFDTRGFGSFGGGNSQGMAVPAASPASNVVFGTLADTTTPTTLKGLRHSPRV
jgi:uncharacterized protein (TIGR03118 family)